MNDEVTQGLDALLPALRTLQRALEQIQAGGATKGSGQTALRHYRLLHEQIARLMPEDRHVTEGLAADVDDTAGDDALVAQALLLTQQLYVYVKSAARQGSEEQATYARPRRGDPNKHDAAQHHHRAGNEHWQSGQAWRGIAEDYKRLGREMRDQIMQQTRDSIRSAMSGIQVDIHRAWEDWDASHPAPPTPPVPPNPPFAGVPPVPPVPPHAPIPPQKAKRRIHIELNDDELNGWAGPFEDAPDPSDNPPTKL